MEMNVCQSSDRVFMTRTWAQAWDHKNKSILLIRVLFYALIAFLDRVGSCKHFSIVCGLDLSSNNNSIKVHQPKWICGVDRLSPHLSLPRTLRTDDKLVFVLRPQIKAKRKKCGA